MAAVEGLRPVSNDTVPIDPNVHVPEHVRRAAAEADALHKQIFNREPEPAPEPSPPAPEPAPAAAAQPEPAPQQAQPVQSPEHQPMKPGEENITAEEWRHRFLSMQGRYNAAARDRGAMEEQMRLLGEELVRTQQLLSQGATAAPQHHEPSRSNHGKLITEDDRANYGDDLIDLARRAGREAVAPELEHLKAENDRLTRQVKTTTKRELFLQLDRAVPNWRQINVSPQFKDVWLHLRNVYTGQVRGEMLKAAVDGADAPKVIALFKDFLAEAAATGQQAPSLQIEPQPVVAAPRQPAVNLETLAAPGRARPASGDSQVPSEKPIYSRADISKFFDDKRRGYYAGREAEVTAIEADLSAAQREGRIR